MRVRAIVNPRAGVAARRALTAIERSRSSWRIEPTVTDGPGHAHDLAAEAVARGDEVVVAAGGDGTANEVARALVGTEVALGVIPVGSGNGLARSLGIPLDPDRALRALASGVRRRMDVGRMNGGLFLNVAGTGFDATVAAAFHERGRNGRRGIPAYFWAGLGEVRRYSAEVRRVETGGEVVELPVFLATCANGRQYGGGAVLAPGALLDDGLLDLVVVEAVSPLEALLGVRRLFTGTVERFPKYRRWRCASAVITAEAARQHHRDGEPCGPVQRIEISVEPSALDVLVTRRVADDPKGPFTGGRLPSDAVAGLEGG